MVAKIAGLVLLGLVLVSASNANADSDKEQAAISVASAWLTQIDAGKYAESWDEASGFFQDAIKREQWMHSLEAVRKPLGHVLSREVKNATYQTSLPGAPDGEYVVIRFQASFENKKSAIETVTPMLEKDGKWRVTGYYIQ